MVKCQGRRPGAANGVADLLGRAVEFVDDFVEPLGDRVIEFVATRVRVLTDSAHALAVVHRDVDDAPICLPDRYGRYGYTGSR
jgi:hypothetical protein